MLIFLKKTVLFSLPLALLFIFPSVVLYLGREYASAQDVVSIQKEFPHALMSFAYNPTSFVPYKMALVQEKNPTIVALGTSRVFQIRKEFFINQEDFVNAGGAGRSLDDIRYFVERLPKDTNVKVIILGLDNETLYEKYESKNFRVEQPLPIRSSSMVTLMARRIYLDYFAHKYSLSQLVQADGTSTNIGLIALANGDGFRADGSYKYTQSENNQHLQEDVQADILKKAKDLKGSSFQSDDPKYQELELNLKKLSSVLELCKTKGITVIGFVPPYPAAIQKSMFDKGGFDKDILLTVPQEVTDIFSKYGDPFFNLASLDTFGGNEGEFVDAVHGSDVMYLRMMIYMAAHSKELGKYVDLNNLKQMLRSTQGNFLQF